MIKIEKTEVVGWEAAIRGMRNPMNSWEKSDSYELNIDPIKNDIPHVKSTYQIGPNDLGLMKKLRNSGTDHRKFMRMIVVYADVTAPLYWWKEYDTYKVGTVANSCSTMHKIAAKEFTLDDFSHEHLVNRDDGTKMSYSMINGEVAINDCRPIDVLQLTCNMLNFYRKNYLDKKDKESWWQMIQLLPSSYNQKRTIEVNYEVLANIWKSRKDHKLDEWSYAFAGSFCDWIANLPYSELITGCEWPSSNRSKEISKKSERGLRQLIKRNSNDVKEEKNGRRDEM